MCATQWLYIHVTWARFSVNDNIIMNDTRIEDILEFGKPTYVIHYKIEMVDPCGTYLSFTQSGYRWCPQLWCQPLMTVEWKWYTDAVCFSNTEWCLDRHVMEKLYTPLKDDDNDVSNCIYSKRDFIRWLQFSTLLGKPRLCGIIIVTS